MADDAAAAGVFNPFGLSPLLWLAAYGAVRVALLGFVDAAVMVLGPRWCAPLPSRAGGAAPVQHRIGKLDITYLAINSVIEFVFVQQLAWHMWTAPAIARAAADLGLANGPLAVWVLLVLDDALYAPAHRLMHWPPVYKYVHKHHHRNTYPARGYIDGANEHPLEQIIALTLWWIAMRATAASVGCHAAAVGAHLGIKALGASFNHTGLDLRFRALGIDYSVRAHETHHRKPNTNFAQYVMFWDRLMGTYAEYPEPRKRQ